MASPSDGDRIDLGGKLPQFDEFAWFAYKELTFNNLDWIRIADPRALKLDDILYSTKTEIHAFQVKWSNQNNPPAFRFKEFKRLLPDLVQALDALKSAHSTENKKIEAHLLTNRPLSIHDSIKTNEDNLGCFSDFIKEVWYRIRIGKQYDNKWKVVVQELCELIDKSESEFTDLCQNLTIRASHQPKKFKSIESESIQQSKDLLQFSRFLFETVIDKKKIVHFNSSDLIKALGWQPRFKTQFQHDLIIDRSKYQPIKSTIQEINKKTKSGEKGYYFLLGGPGTGKSTLLSQWSKNRRERVIKYYVFDFTNPAENYSLRGESMTLYFDLVTQLRNEGIGSTQTLPHYDLHFLRDTFYKQLNELNEKYKKNGRRTIIIIDGLDHIPREYKSVKQSFLRDLPPPDSIPNGIQIILGSQSFELEDLNRDIISEWKKGERSVTINQMSRGAVNSYLNSIDLSVKLTEEQKDQVFEKSQGHPLYLSYLTEKLLTSDNPGNLINQFEQIVGDIETYYDKIWSEINKDAQLVHLLGLLSRIRGNINPKFIEEWRFTEQTFINFNDKAHHLFDKSIDRWAFFHNSFRQFLVSETSKSPITGELKKSRDVDFHRELADFYKKSAIEQPWNRLYHLFVIGNYEETNSSTKSEALDEFVNVAKPESFIQQYNNFRPPNKIKEDINLGIQISLLRKDVYLLTRYMFSAAELQRKFFHFDPGSLTEEFLELGKSHIAKDYLRQDSALLCDKKYGLHASRFFFVYGDKVEAKILFTIAEPEQIVGNSIVLDSDHRYSEDFDLLEEWIYTATLFIDYNTIFQFISNLVFQNDHFQSHKSLNQSKQELYHVLGNALIELHKWEAVEKVTQQFSDDKYGRQNLFLTLKDAIEECMYSREQGRAQYYLKLLLIRFEIESINSYGRVLIANLIYKVTGDLMLPEKWIEGVQQPESPLDIGLGFENNLAPFEYRIILNKLLILNGHELNVLTAVEDPSDPRDIWVVEFERKLCLISALIADGQLQNKSNSLLKRVKPIVQFFYRKSSFKDRNWLSLERRRGAYFDLLIYAISIFGSTQLSIIANHFFSEFQRVPQFWPHDLRREIIISCFEYGLDKEIACKQLKLLESGMKDEHDLTGRIDTCLHHAKAWLKLGYRSKTQYWIQQTLDESFGVGYRKDYQFNTWIDWLDLINDHDPKGATKRIKWFTSQLGHIHETTEGPAGLRASEELLRITIKFNYSFGIEQLEWQLNKGLTHFEDALGILLEEHLKQGQDFIIAFLLYTDLFVLISEQPRIKLLELLLQVGYSRNSSDFISDYLPEIIKAIEIKALEENRSVQIETISHFLLDAGVDPKRFISIKPQKSKRPSHDSSNTLTLLPDHQILTENEVLQKVNTTKEVKELLTNEDPVNSYFNWNKVFDKVESELTLDVINEFSKIHSSNRKSTFFFSKLSRLALRQGGKELAEALGVKALKYSGSMGWSKFYDGGTRIEAFKVLQDISKKEYTDIAFKTFSTDLVASDYPSSYIEHIDEILPIITDDFDVSKAWNEVEGYLNRLMANDDPIPDTPEFVEDISPNVAINRFLLNLSDHYVGVISGKARIVVVKLLSIDGYNEIVSLVKNLSQGSIADQELLFSILSMIKFYCPDKLVLFKDELIAHQLSENYFIRSTARELISEILPDYHLKTPHEKRLKPIYSLHFPPEDFTDTYQIKLADQDKNRIGIESLIRPLLNWIGYISFLTGIKQENLLYRTNEIISNPENQEVLSYEFEKSIEENLKNIRLRYPFSKPAVVEGKRALLRIITELNDASALHTDSILKSICGLYDFQLSFLEEVHRPFFIRRLSDGEYSFVDVDWVNDVDNCSRLKGNLISLEDGWKVVGEYSVVKSLNWGIAMQTFMSQLRIDEEKFEEELYEIFGTTFHKSIDEYANLNNAISRPYIILLNDHRFYQFDIKSHWLTFNPVLASHLGWKPGKELLSWNDSAGAPVAKSVFWSSGNIDMQPPHLHSESGQGWLVLLSNSGLKEIEELESKLIIEKKVKRSYHSDQGFLQNEKAVSLRYTAE